MARRVEARRHRAAQRPLGRCSRRAASAMAAAPVALGRAFCAQYVHLPRSAAVYEAGEAATFARGAGFCAAMAAEPRCLSSPATTEGYQARVRLDRPAQGGRPGGAALAAGVLGRFDRGRGRCTLDLHFGGLSSGRTRRPCLNWRNTWHGGPKAAERRLGSARSLPKPQGESRPGAGALSSLCAASAGTDGRHDGGRRRRRSRSSCSTRPCASRWELACRRAPGCAINWLAEGGRAGDGQTAGPASHSPAACAPRRRLRRSTSAARRHGRRRNARLTWARRAPGRQRPTTGTGRRHRALDEPEERYRLEVLRRRHRQARGRGDRARLRPIRPPTRLADFGTVSRSSLVGCGSGGTWAEGLVAGTGVRPSRS